MCIRDRPSDVLAIGDEVDCQIVEINNETKQIGLSMKALMKDEAPAAVAEAVSYTHLDVYKRQGYDR